MNFIAFRKLHFPSFQSLFKTKREDPLVWLQFNFDGIWVYQLAWMTRCSQGRDDDKDQVTEFNQPAAFTTKQLTLSEWVVLEAFLRKTILLQRRHCSTPWARSGFHPCINDTAKVDLSKTIFFQAESSIDRLTWLVINVNFLSNTVSRSKRDWFLHFSRWYREWIEYWIVEIVLSNNWICWSANVISVHIMLKLIDIRIAIVLL